MAATDVRMEPVDEEGHKQETTNALLRAAHEGNMELLAKMLTDGIPADVANQGGLQAIHFAAKAGRVEIIDELLDHGADVNAKTARGYTPMHVAALLGQAEVIKMLLRHNADVNIVANCNDDHFTALYIAAQIGHQEIVTLLLAQGADPTITTKNGCTPCDVAQQQRFRAVSELLAEYEKRRHNMAVAKNNMEPPAEHQQNGSVADDEDDGSHEHDVIVRKRIGNMGRKNFRPKSGPPPVCEEAIPSPKPSPLKLPKQMNGSP